jgi:hypothetical protein
VVSLIVAPDAFDRAIDRVMIRAAGTSA